MPATRRAFAQRVAGIDVLWAQFAFMPAAWVTRS
jgi:hypothetical protein